MSTTRTDVRPYGDGYQLTFHGHPYQVQPGQRGWDIAYRGRTSGGNPSADHAIDAIQQALFCPLDCLDCHRANLASRYH
jgi:hypothetical protein